MAGGHLKELQRAISNPMSNLGMIFDEGTKRVFKAVGLSTGSQSLSEFVAPQLRSSASLAVRGVDNFATSVEHLLRKYNKNIVHEQFLLTRLGNSAIDIFVMMVVLSRATRAVNKNFSSAAHEVNMANVICTEVGLTLMLSLMHSRDSLINCPFLPLFPSFCFNRLQNVSNTIWRPLDHQDR